MNRRSISAALTRSYSLPAGGGLTVHARAVDGPGNVTGRGINLYMYPADLASLVGIVAELYPDLILEVAKAIVQADELAANANSANEARQYERQVKGQGPSYGRARVINSAASRAITPTTREHQ
jgi:hypothetical protein